jgi:hypothetical protein
MMALNSSSSQRLLKEIDLNNAEFSTYRGGLNSANPGSPIIVLEM